MTSSVPQGGETTSRSDGAHNVDDIHGSVRKAILRGELAPETVVSQVQLARDLGVSRTPLREALRMLQREGLIESRHNQRMRVAAFSLPDLEQLYIMRVTLESTAIRLTIPGLISEDIASLEGDLAQMTHFDEQADFERWEVPHRAFHGLLTVGAGSRISIELSQLSDHAERYRRLHATRVPKTRPRVAREHRLILDAAKTHAAETGARRLGAHLAQTAFEVMELIDISYKPEALCETLEHLVGPEEPWESST